LLTWFRDYLLRPLGWSRPGRLKWMRNIMLVFLASGLWHGASWTFVLFGAVNGAMLVFGVTTRRWRERRWESVHRWVSRLAPRISRGVTWARPWLARVVVFHLMTAGLVLFRAPSLQRAFELYGSLWHGLGTSALTRWLMLRPYEFFLACVALALFVSVQLVGPRIGHDQGLAQRPRWLRWSALYSLALATLMLGEFGTEAFYYFQF